MKSIFLNRITLALTIGLSIFTTVSKAQETQNVALSNYNGISVSNGIDVFLTQSNAENIRVSANKDILQYVVVEKEGTVLRIRFKEHTNVNRLFKKDQAVKVYVNIKNLESLTSSGGSDIFSQNQLKADKLVIRSSGGSDMKLDVAIKDLEITSSGSSDVHLKGTASNISIAASGSSDIKALDLITDYAKVRCSGSSDVELYVNKGIEVSAGGSSDVRFKGEAALNKVSTSGGSDVKRIK